MKDLFRLHAEIDDRVDAVRSGRSWPCSKGCDACCRRLAEIPRLTASEWDWLQQGLAALPADALGGVRAKVEALACETSRPLVCPLLDGDTGACRVYAHRPVACRTYGFYVQRDLGLYCGDIEARVAAGELMEVVWGNHDAVDRELGARGESRPLDAWFSRWTADR